MKIMMMSLCLRFCLLFLRDPSPNKEYWICFGGQLSSSVQVATPTLCSLGEYIIHAREFRFLQDDLSIYYTLNRRSSATVVSELNSVPANIFHNIVRSLIQWLVLQSRLSPFLNMVICWASFQSAGTSKFSQVSFMIV